jgi:hypothetical protein
VNWPLVDVLKTFGGMRIEDDLVVGTSHHDNLTRAYLTAGGGKVG